MLVAAAWLASIGANAATQITTYHYDHFRTGWDQTETILTPANVASSSFGLLMQVHVDEQVDAQPLYVPKQFINGALHDVVYIATENDTIYAIDADTGARLIIQSFGTPVPIAALPGKCDNNATRVGFNSTPVYDPVANLIYAISYTYENNVAVFRLHEINASTLQDNVPSVVVSAPAKLSNGAALRFSATDQRQRPALLLSKDKIYAGFGGWCDVDRNNSRGWVLGWTAGTLKPLASNYLVNKNAATPEPLTEFFLGDVWMAGYGLAADSNGTVFFATGNSDRYGDTYSAAYNLEESVLKLSGDLSRVDDYFTPTGTYGYAALDKDDFDFGAGGVLLLPPQPGKIPLLAVAAGKEGPMYLLNRDLLGGLHTPNKVVGTYPNDGCWCGQSYYTGSDGIGRVVESTGVTLRVWRLVTSATAAPTLTLESSAALSPTSGQDPGFFTAISSNGQTANTAVIWAVSHPFDATKDVYLQAFDPANGSKQVYSAVAGTWARAGSSDSNIVPVVADGHVFVASYDYLSIFGLGAPASHIAYRAPAPAQPVTLAGAPHQIHGIVTLSDGPRFSLRTRGGTLVRIDAAVAEARPPRVGQAIMAAGDYDARGTLMAKYVYRQKPQPALWDPDM
jgi:hypothetical protein